MPGTGPPDPCCQFGTYLTTQVEDVTDRGGRRFFDRLPPLLVRPLTAPVLRVSCCDGMQRGAHIYGPIPVSSVS